MVDEKFKVQSVNNRLIIKDLETGKKLDMSNKWHVKQLTDLLNDWYLIIKDKWGL